MQLLGTKGIRMTAYHPITNGLVERLQHQLMASLKVQPDPGLHLLLCLVTCPLPTHKCLTNKNNHNLALSTLPARLARAS